MDFGAAMFFTEYSMTSVELGQALQNARIAPKGWGFLASVFRLASL
jgi:hypothetical protein